MTHMSNIIDF